MEGLGRDSGFLAFGATSEALLPACVLAFWIHGIRGEHRTNKRQS